tara:strand:- start:2935 stop:3108 length:174 start_codon:yes stop_codon:yes gene_type:complete
MKRLTERLKKFVGKKVDGLKEYGVRIVSGCVSCGIEAADYDFVNGYTSKKSGKDYWK